MVLEENEPHTRLEYLRAPLHQISSTEVAVQAYVMPPGRPNAAKHALLSAHLYQETPPGKMKLEHITAVFATFSDAAAQNECYSRGRRQKKSRTRKIINERSKNEMPIIDSLKASIAKVFTTLTSSLEIIRRFNTATPNNEQHVFFKKKNNIIVFSVN